MSSREMDVDRLFVRLGIFGNPCGLPRGSAVLTRPKIHVKTEVFEARELAESTEEEPCQNRPAQFTGALLAIG